MLNLDTHIFLKSLTDELTGDEAALLNSDRWGISSIVIWEIGILAELRRINLDLDDQEMREALESVYVFPIDAEVVMMRRALDFRSDPADELIAATSLLHKVPLVTRDRRIRRSKRVPLAM